MYKFQILSISIVLIKFIVFEINLIPHLLSMKSLILYIPENNFNALKQILQEVNVDGITYFSISWVWDQ